MCCVCQSSAEGDRAAASALLPAGCGLVQQQDGGNREGEQNPIRIQELVSLNGSKLQVCFLHQAISSALGPKEIQMRPFEDIYLIRDMSVGVLFSFPLSGP